MADNQEKKYKFAVIATDVVIFTVRGNVLQILLVKMKRAPFIGMWAAPGGLVKPEESVDEAAKRHLEAQTGLKNVYIEQLYTFGEVDRDPFGRVVSVAYVALIPYNAEVKTGEEYSEIDWFPVRTLPKLAYDHEEVIRYAVARLRAKLEYTNIVYSLLPKEFTLGELQSVYEIVRGRRLDKRNFRRKILSLGTIRKSPQKKQGAAHRPATLYCFRKRAPQFVEMI